MKNIWIIDHYSSEPEHGGISRQYDFAVELSRQGYSVLVISSSFSHFHHRYIHQAPLSISQIAPSAHYAYVKTHAYESNGGIDRVRSMFSFVRAVRKHQNELVKRFGKPDVVEGCSIHPLAWVAAEDVARRHQARFVAEVRDLWPRCGFLIVRRSLGVQWCSISDFWRNGHIVRHPGLFTLCSMETAIWLTNWACPEARWP